MSSPLTQKHCRPCDGGVAPLTLAQAEELRKQTPEWEIFEDQSSPEFMVSHVEPRLRVLKISRTFKFKNFKETREFFNAVADTADSENHHPDFAVSYKQCTLTLFTHTIGGLSENDFILAAKVDALCHPE